MDAVDTKDAGNRIVFADVMMPGLDGTELIPLMREKCGEETIFVLMSSQHSYMKTGYSVEAFDFICKPFSYEDILSVIKRAYNRFAACSKGSFGFYADKTNYKVAYSDIVAVNVVRNYAVLYSRTRKFCFRATVKRLLEQLPEQFIQVSGNTIVNITRVTSISTKKVTLRNDDMIFEVTKPYFDGLLEAFKNHN